MFRKVEEIFPRSDPSSPRLPENKGLDICKREYRIMAGGPVGCIHELVEHVAIPNNYKQLLLVDLDDIYLYDIEKDLILSEIKQGTF